MEIIEKIKEMQTISNKLHQSNKTIAFIPTMGYLHKGHLDLMKVAKETADIVVISIFVNPTQFAPNEDFNKYPRDFQRDKELAESIGAEYIFFPDINEMYPESYSTKIEILGITEKFEGASRPEHFNGVATVVSKLFNAVKPDYAIFGQKDYQQTLVIRQLVDDLNYGVKIIVTPTTREEKGLALSSRNAYLSQSHRKKATIIYKSLENTLKAIENGENRRKVINALLHKSLRSEKDIRIDYALSADADNLNEPEEFEPGQHVILLIACYLGRTRLIDNALITIPGKSKEFNQSYTDTLPKI